MKLVRTIIACLLGAWVAVQVWAFQAHYAAVLGEPWRFGALPLYGLLAGTQWLIWWGVRVPQMFLWGSVLGALITGGLLWLTWRPGPPTPTATAPAAWATARQQRKEHITRRGGVVIGKERSPHG